MDLSQEPNEQQLKVVYDQYSSNLIQFVTSACDEETLEIAACSLADSGSITFQDLRAYENNNSTIVDAYGNGFLEFYELIHHDRFNVNDEFIFFSISNGIFTMSESNYIDALYTNKEMIIDAYITALIQGQAVMGIPEWFERINQYISENEDLTI